MKQHHELSTDEVLAEEATLLPDREALSLINVAPVIGVNLGMALNVLSANSVANAMSGQLLVVGQS